MPVLAAAPSLEGVQQPALHIAKHAKSPLSCRMPVCVYACVQVSRRCYQVLLAHMTRFTYSPTGALKWKKDVSEYAEVLASFKVPAADEDMVYLQQVGSDGCWPVHGLSAATRLVLRVWCRNTASASSQTTVC